MSDVIGTQPVTPNNRTGYLFPEALIRQFIAFQFGQVHSTIDNPQVTIIDEMFHRFGPDIVKQVKEWWRDSPNIPVTLNYPRHDISFPFVCVVNAGEQEKQAEAYLGDYAGRARYAQSQVTLLGGATPETRPKALYTRDVLSLPLTHQTKVFVAAKDPDLVTYLYHLIFALLIVNKVDFDRYGGMRSLVISGSDLEHHPELFPEFAYFKIISLTFDTNLDVPLQKQSTIGGVDVGLSTMIDGLVTSNVTSGG